MTDEERDDEERDDEELLRELESSFRESPGGRQSPGRACGLESLGSLVQSHKREQALRLLDEVLYEVACIRSAADQVCESIEWVMRLLDEEQASE